MAVAASPNYAEQITALQTSDAEIKREIVALRARLDSMLENAQAANKVAQADRSTEIANLRAHIEKRIADLREDARQGFAELRAEVEQHFTGVDQRFTGVEERFTGVDQRFTSVEERFTGVEGRIADLRVDIEKRIAELRVDIEKRIAELHAEMDRRFADLRVSMEKRFAELLEIIKNNEVEAARRETRMIQAVHNLTKWMIGGALTVIAVVVATARYIGPATGAG